MTVKTMDLAGRRYAWREAGEGAPLLLFHGFPFTSESFWPQLETPPPGVRVIAPDHRGFGQSAPAPTATMDELAQDGLALLDALGLPQAAVGGVSMGGYVALALLRLAPARVRALALLDTQALADDEAGKTRREDLARQAEQQGMDPVVKAFLPKLFSPQSPPPVVARIEAIMRGVDPKGAAAALRGMAQRQDTRDVLGRFAGPCLVAVGSLDVITPLARAQEMADLCAGSRLEVVEGAAHLAHLEAPARVSAALGALVASSK